MKKINLILITISLILISLVSNTQCNVPGFTVNPTNGTCISNASIAVQVPGASTCSGWSIILTRPDNSETSRVLPANGGPEIFSSLSAGNYSVRLFNGLTTIQHSGNPINITTSYVPMSITSNSIAPTCRPESNNYVPDGALTINVPTGGNGPFSYRVTSSLGTQNFGPTTNRTHTFTGMPNGETVSFTVFNQQGNPSCEVSTTQTSTLVSNTDIGIRFVVDGAVIFQRKCGGDACDVMNITTNILCDTSNLSFLQLPGNAAISINGGSYTDLTYKESLSLIYHTFNYPPGYASGTPATFRFISKCGDTTSITTTGILSNGLRAFDGGSVFDTDSCDFDNSIRILGAVTGGIYTYDFCSNNNVVLERETPTGSSVWDTIYTAQSDFMSYSIPVDSTGNYRGTMSDSCHTVTRTYTLNGGSVTLNDLAITEQPSLLEGTSSINIGRSNLWAGQYPWRNKPLPITIEILPDPYYPSATINPTQPFSLAGSYTNTFPYSIQVNSYPNVQNIAIGDLPLGSYTINLRAICVDYNGDTIIDISRSEKDTLVNPVSYNPIIEIAYGCNDAIVKWNMQDTNVFYNPISPWVGYSVSIIDSVTNVIIDTKNGGKDMMNNSFSNITAGVYYLRFTNNGYVGPFDNSFARNTSANTFYQTTVQVLPYQNITLNTSVYACTDTNGLISVNISGGTPVYPLIYNLSDTNGNLIYSDTAKTDTSSIANGISYLNIDTGYYSLNVISGYSAVTPNGCYSFNQTFQLYNSAALTKIITNDSIVCQSNSVTQLGVLLNNDIWNINWYNSSNILLASDTNSVTVNPTVTGNYIVNYQLKSGLGCLAATLYSDTLELVVIVEPDTTKNILGDTICHGSTAIITVLNADSNVIYEVYQANDTLAQRIIDTATLNGSLTFTIPNSLLTVGINTFQIQASNSYCLGGFIDSLALVLVYDTIAPFFIDNDTTIFVSCVGDIPVPPSGILLDSSGLVNVITSITLTDSSCTNQFTQIIQLVAIDVCGLTDTMIQTVIVKDSIAPIVICKDTTLYLNALGQVNIDTSYVFLSATDNCSIDSIWILTNIINCSTTGIQTIQVYARDLCNNIDSCTATVTVLDTINPLVLCKDTTVYLSAAGTYSIDTSYLFASASDNCGIDSIWIPITNYTCSDTGINTVTIYVRDVNNNIDSCSATVTVLDTVNPTITCKNATIYLDINGQFIIDTSHVYSSSFAGCGLDSIWIADSLFDCSRIGVNTVAVYARDINGNTDSCQAQVTVLDSINPIITCGSTLYDTVTNSCEYRVPDFRSLTQPTDNCTDSINFQIIQTPLPGTLVTVQDEIIQNITLTVTDTNGNQSVCMFAVNIICRDELEIPEFISPNGDGKNDVWFIKGIDVYPNNGVKIFNRYGTIVYEAKSYTNTWNGTANTGFIFQAGNTDQILPSGTYFYILELDINDNNAEVFTGFIQIQK